MDPIDALSISPDARNWLATSRRPRILHVFDEACNLINERMEVLSIVAQGIGNGPFNLVIDETMSFSKHLNVESPISLEPGRLKVGEVTIDMENANLWNPRPDWETLSARQNAIRSQLMSLPMMDYEPALPKSLISNLSPALAAPSMASALALTAQLAGLGPGLTPAGDDFIMGSIYAAWIIHPRDVVGVLAAEVANTAAPLTTSLSAAWLRSAGKGEAGIAWHDFFDSLISGKSAAVRESMNRILSAGETSGADTLAGFVRVMARSQLASSETS